MYCIFKILRHNETALTYGKTTMQLGIRMIFASKKLIHINTKHPQHPTYKVNFQFVSFE